jgi:hypothetical protein
MAILGNARSSFVFCVAISCLSLKTSVFAQDTYVYDYAGSFEQAKNISALEDGLFGDTVSYVDGGISFDVVDVVAKTNVKLPLQFGRRLRPFAETFGHSGNAATDATMLILGLRWRPDIPYLSGVYPKTDGLYGGSRPRCTGGSLDPYALNVQGSPPILPYNYWFGFQANIPGYGQESLWSLTPGSQVPSDPETYKFSSMNNWRVSCLPSLKNGPGQGYVVLLPDGAKYYLDWLALRPVASVQIGGRSDQRVEMYFFATKAEDRFGNTITYEYDDQNPTHLTKMTASDGAQIVIEYTNGRVSEVTTGTQVWQYKYVQDSLWWELDQVILPDGSSWRLSSRPVYFQGATNLPTFGYLCNFSAGQYTSAGTSPQYRHTMVHPSGATGEFTYKHIALGYNNVPYGYCRMNQAPTAYVGRVPAYTSFPLVSKKITGPGLVARAWTISYAPSWSYASDCASGCPNTSTTKVTESDGTVNEYVYGNDSQVNANQLLTHTIRKAGQVYRRTENRYMTSITGQPFPDYVTGPIDATPPYTLESEFFRRNRPLVETSIYQDGVVFKSLVNQFDSFARPLNVTRSSSPAP